MRREIYEFLAQSECFDKDRRVPFNPNTRRVSEVVDSLKARAQRTTEAPAWLNGGKHPPAAEILACRNGLLHITSRDFHPHTPEFFGLNALDLDYNASAPQPERWLRLIAEEVWPKDEAQRALLQEIMGYLLAADTSQQKIFALIGPKRSTKGTIVKVITTLKSAVSPSASSLSQQFGLQPLIGKDLAIFQDARFSGRSDLALLAERLLSISGEDQQTIDRKYLPAWTGKLPTRFLIVSNEVPMLPDASGALASRMLILRTKQSFIGRENPRLLNELLAELPRILNWALTGLARLAQRGHFAEPPSSVALREEMEEAGSPIEAFIRDRCEIGPDLSIETGKLFAAWQTHCGPNGIQPGDYAQFGLKLRACVPELETKQERIPGSAKRVRRYVGIGLRGAEVSRDVTRDSNLHLIKKEIGGEDRPVTGDMRDMLRPIL